MKKRIIIIIIFFVLTISAYLIGKRLVWNYKVAHAEKKVTLVRNDVYVYQDVKIRNLIQEINGELTTNPKIDTSELGTKKVKFNYTTDEGYPVSYEVEIEVKDITPPLIFQSKKKTIYTDYEGDLEKELFCGDNYDSNPKCWIEGDYDIKIPGTYEVTFIGEDSSGNTSKNKFDLTVRKRQTYSGGSTSKTYNYTYFNDVKENYKGEGLQYGIDISHWQGDIDFQKVKEAGVEFAYIRVGRGDGIGKDYVLDSKFERNIKGFNKVGIPVGVYFYSNANGSKDAEKEAKWIVKQIKKYKVDLEIVYDWENWGDFQSYNLSFYGLKESYKSFKNTIEKSGHKAMLYSSKSYLESVWGGQLNPVWLAHYTKNTSYGGSYVVWQLSDTGYVDGIEGYVDLDIRYN